MNELISCRATANLIGMPARTFLRWVGDGFFHPECLMIPPKGNKRIRITKLIFHHPGLFSAETINAIRAKLAK